MRTARGIFQAGRDSLAVAAIPDGNPVAPPKLTRDTPVLDIVEPVQIGLLPAFGMKLQITAPSCFGSRFGPAASCLQTTANSNAAR